MTCRTWQDMPDWLVMAVRASHASAISDGERGAGEQDVTRLTARVLRDDPEFTRLLVERFIRSLVRAPKARRRTKTDRARDALMAECVRLSGEGMSLRAIGHQKGISHQTVANLIAEWHACLPEMTASLVRAAAPAVNLSRQNNPAGLTAQVDSDPNVIPIRRPA